MRPPHLVSLVLWCAIALSACGDRSSAPATRAKICLESPDVRPFALVATAIAFRDIARRDLVAAAKQFDAEGALATLTGRPATESEPAIWPLFFSGSSILAGCGAADRPVTCFFNPFVDAGVFIRWRHPEGECLIDSVWVEDGRSFCDGSGTGAPAKPRWMDWTAKMSMRRALGRESDQFVAEFERRFPPMATAAADAATAEPQERWISLVEDRLLHATACLRAAHDPKAGTLGQWLLALRARLRQGDGAGLRELLPDPEQATGDLLAALPENLRREVLPIFAHINQGEIVVHLVPPTQPSVCIACLFQPSGPGPEAPVAARRVALFNLDAEPAPAEGGAP